MDTANILVALGGDTKNVVPKYNVTAAEIAVLQAIHGYDAISEIEPTGSVPTNNRAERERLREEYGNARDSDNRSIVDGLYPGAAARVFEKLSELTLVEEQFKTLERVTVGEAPIGPTEDMVEEVEAELAPKPKKTTKKKAPEPAAEASVDIEDLDDVLE